jgi:antitoxin component YwqK of YwqJK toxin-antitoxin module
VSLAQVFRFTAHIEEKTRMHVALLLIATTLVQGDGAESLDTCRTYYRGRKLKEQYTFYEDTTGDTVKHGLYEKWYENGQIAERRYYERGKKDSV